MLTDTLGVITTTGVTANLPWPLVWLAMGAFVPGTMVAGRWLRDCAGQLWTWAREYDEAKQAREEAPGEP